MFAIRSPRRPFKAPIRYTFTVHPKRDAVRCTGGLSGGARRGVRWTIPHRTPRSSDTPTAYATAGDTFGMRTPRSGQRRHCPEIGAVSSPGLVLLVVLVIGRRGGLFAVLVAWLALQRRLGAAGLAGGDLTPVPELGLGLDEHVDRVLGVAGGPSSLVHEHAAGR